MSDFRKEKGPTDGRGEDDMTWITTDNGAHVPIEDGQSKAAAIKEHFGTDKKTFLEKDKQIKNLIYALKEIKNIKQKELVDYIKGLEPISLKIKDDEILAEFDSFGARKNVYVQGNSDSEGQRYKLENIEELPKVIKTSKFLRSKNEEGKKNKAHIGVKQWHYFVNQIQTENGKFDITVNVRDKGDRQFVYEVSFRKK